VDAGTLYVVATPIGHLEDITFRALRVLREVALVAAEDTRRTGLLLRHFGIGTPLISLHEHNEGQKTENLLARLRRGESIAVVSDAGTPAISDPGAKLVAAARTAGLPVVPVPGASAVMAALSVSGLEDDAFCFLGFPPTKAKDRRTWLSKVSSAVDSSAVVFFEAPHRILATLEDLNILAIDRLFLFRELTKLHESFYMGAPAEVSRQISPVAGEFTGVIPRRVASPDTQARPTDAEIVAMLGQIPDKRGRAAARAIAERTGLSVNEVYAVIRGVRH
jgi:16S rRNA (cytidine1402-2'-O)-methyltransferase